MSNSRRRVSYLSRRGGIYYLRVRVPHDLVERVGRFEIRRSLGVARSDQARMLAAKYAARVFEVFSMLRSEQNSKAEIVEIIQSVFSDLSFDLERHPFAFKASDVDQELAAQLSMSREYEAVLFQALECFNPAQSDTTGARRLLAEKVPGFEQLPDSDQHDLLVGVLRALIEQQRQFRFRLDERLLPYKPHDKLFDVATEHSRPPVHAKKQGASAAERPSGPKIVDLVDRYLAAKKVSCTPKNHQNDVGKTSATD